MPSNSPEALVSSSARRAYQAFGRLSSFKGADRSRCVKAMASAISKSFNEILEANTLDLEISREMAVPDLIINWLKLTPERLQTTVDILDRIASLSDPLQLMINATYQLSFSQTYCQRMPLGVIALIYQAFPELGAIATAMAIKTGNSIILRGSSEATHSNAAIANVLKTALEDTNLPSECLEILSSDQGCAIQDLVTQDQYINLVIPYGRPSLIQQVVKFATAPVLKSAMGNCYLYWSFGGNLELVRSIIIDSHSSQPDAVNAIEKVLIHRSLKPSSLVRLFNSLQEKKFKLRAPQSLVDEFPEHLTLADNSEWSTAYLDKIVAFMVVDTLEEAIAHINHYSSNHADCLVTESYEESRYFAAHIDSALVYINSSPKFCRIPKGGETVFLGMSNQKGQRRGLISLDTFTTLKQVVQGDGQV